MIKDYLEIMTESAMKYRLDAQGSIKRNSHLTNVIPLFYIDQEDVDAVLVDFINYIAYTRGVDYELCTKDLSKESNKEPNKENNHD